MIVNMLISSGIGAIIDHCKGTGFGYPTTLTVKRVKPSSSTGATSNSMQRRPVRQDNDD